MQRQLQMADERDLIAKMQVSRRVKKIGSAHTNNSPM